MSGRSLVICHQFETSLKKYEDAFRLRLKNLRAEQWPSPATEICAPQAKEFTDFQAKLQEVSPANPLSQLEFFSEDSNGNRYYCRGTENWKAYYVTEDNPQPSVVALRLFYKSSEKKILGELERALKDYRKDNG